MSQQTFEHRRIVQLSKELDAQRDKSARLAKDGSYLNARLKEAQEEIQQSKQKLIEYQINNHRLTENLRQTQRECQKLREELDQQQKARSNSDVENVRQRQKMDELRQEMEEYENKTKAILYERAQELAFKDKQIYRLKEQNIQVQKIYLNQREKLQKREEKHLRDLTRLFQDFQALRKQLQHLKKQHVQDLESERKKYKRQLEQVLVHIERIEAKIRKEEDMQEEIDQLKGRLEDVVRQNSQKIIELYKYKYAK